MEFGLGILLGGFAGAVLATFILDQRARTATAERRLANKENGNLSRIIGRQRFAIAELKAKLAQFQPVLTPEERKARYEAHRQTAARPQLPH